MVACAQPENSKGALDSFFSVKGRDLLDPRLGPSGRCSRSLALLRFDAGPETRDTVEVTHLSFLFTCSLRQHLTLDEPPVKLSFAPFPSHSCLAASLVISLTGIALTRRRLAITMAGWVTEDEFCPGLGIVDDARSAPFTGTLKQSNRRNGSPLSSLVRVRVASDDETSPIDPNHDGSIGILDPRRFTPNLHASLVSEILALRRDQEEKTKHIDSLEITLHTAKEDQERLQGTITETNKENRSLKRQIALLEGGTSSALGELALERDEAVDSVTEIRRRLEAAQKKLRTQEHDSQRVHDLLEQEKKSWEDERRLLERKLHVTESRLKTVVDEVAVYHQDAQQELVRPPNDSDAEQSDGEGQARSQRTMSITDSIHRSLYSHGPEEHRGRCLADELDLSDDDADGDSRGSIPSHPPSPQLSRPRGSLDSLGTNRSQSIGEERNESRSAAPIRVDVGIQYSPPPSPQLRVTDIMRRRRMSGLDSPRGDSEIEANQRRKRVQINRPVKPVPVKTDPKTGQTTEEPRTPPKTPETPRQEPTRQLLVNSSTQTAPETWSPVQLSIPSISVQPPRSRPTTPLSPRLPQYTKSVGCQASLAPAPTRDASVQTQTIQIDQRLAQLPRHLQPWTISSRPSSPDIGNSGEPPTRDRKRLTQGGNVPDSPPTPTACDSYRGPERPPSNSRSWRLSSLYAGFDTASSDGLDEFGHVVYMGDVEYRNGLSTRRASPIVVPSPLPDELVDSTSGLPPAMPEVYSTFSLVDKENRAGSAGWRSGRGHDSKPSGRDSAMRRTALIQSGIASHKMRSRSPSWPDPSYPPFPIPQRSSSRKPDKDADAGSDGQSSPTRKGRSIRKARSAVALSRGQRHRRRGSRSPEPPLPANDITAPGRRHVGNGQRRGHRHQPSTTAADYIHYTGSSSAPQTTGVVDAIAHAMVGEWMLKYVRRRRSFGIPDSTGKDDSSNDRHKRWVWLAPYERAILWSSKQPTSGSALMGKSGRKLVIQSVLDVKDTNPAPRVMASVFNRSILILTPQRALKFTAPSAERHYLWLTALSFLAHSSQAIPDLLSPPNAELKRQPTAEAVVLRPPRFRTTGIRDSIRLAKGKAEGPKLSRTDDLASPTLSGTGHNREPSADAAEPPMIPASAYQPPANAATRAGLPTSAPHPARRTRSRRGT
ncbi:nuclear migration protein [Ophiocordyceps camponoti-floridani]|uniref:Nuclear migration protein n=1 Tax=Ophiocordyceps camponoti-floridani TaxID=2030778 RepID=A0A8H4Q0B0_9HYPO|nr:nuclear migration protein [Ophiocordyceps camponoti-floridani]